MHRKHSESVHFLNGMLLNSPAVHTLTFFMASTLGGRLSCVQNLSTLLYSLEIRVILEDFRDVKADVRKDVAIKMRETHPVNQQAL